MRLAPAHYARGRVSTGARGQEIGRARKERGVAGGVQANEKDAAPNRDGVLLR